MRSRKCFPQIRKRPQAHPIDARGDRTQNAFRTGETFDPSVRKADKNKLKSSLAPGKLMGEYKANLDAL